MYYEGCEEKKGIDHDVEIINKLKQNFQWFCMKWLRYQRVVSLETKVGITSQRNKWANTDPRINRGWNQVPRRSKHPLSTGHTRRDPSFVIMHAELSAVKVSVPSTV
jgi:hypothetical protein